MKKIISVMLLLTLSITTFSQIQNGANTAPNVLYTCNTTGVIAINTPVSFTSQFGTSSTIDCQFFKSLQVTCTTIGTTGVLVAQFSNDPAFAIFTTGTIVSATGGYAASITGNALFTVAITARYCRFQMTTATTAGTTLLTVSGTQINGRDVYIVNNLSLSSSSNLIGDIGMQYRNNATGGASRNHLISAANTNATIVKAGAGRIYGYSISNTNAAFRYVKFHNQTTTPTAGTGVVQTIAIPPNSTVVFQMPGGISFTTGITFTTTSGSADNDAVAVAIGDLIIDIFFL